VSCVDVGDEVGLGGLPVEQLAGLGARGRGVLGDEAGDETEPLGGVIRFDDARREEPM
jgi:hypothetical protein